MEEAYEDDDEILLPSLPTKPQKTLFSYFNVERTNISSELKGKNLESKTNKPRIEWSGNKKSNKDKEKSRNSCGISISLFGENARKKIGLNSKKSPNVNGQLEKYLTGESNGENVEKDVENNNDNIELEKHRGLHEDLDGKYDNEGNDSQNEITTDEELNKTDPCTDNIICEDKDESCCHSQTKNEENKKICGLPLDKETVSLVEHNESTNKKAKSKKEISKQQFDYSGEELNKSDPLNNDITCQNEEENKEICDLNCSNKETPVEPNVSPCKKVKRKKKRAKQPFDSSDEELSETDHNNDTACQNKDENKETGGLNYLDEEAVSAVDSKEIALTATEKEISSVHDITCQNTDVGFTIPYLQKEEEKMDDFNSLDNKRDRTCQNTDAEFTSPYLQKEEEQMDGIICLDNERVLPVKPNEMVPENETDDNKCYVESESVHGIGNATKKTFKNLKMFGNVYPSTSCSKYKSLLSLTDTVESSFNVPVNDNLHTRTVEDYLRILQSEYPDIDVKKIFLQLLNCQKMTITKNLTKVQSSKKVLETLWEIDSKLKSDEIALAEEIRLKNEELALAQLKKKKKNDIRSSFKRKKAKKKVTVDIIVPDILEDEENDVDNSNNIGNKTESVKKGQKKCKNKVNVDVITLDPLEEVYIVDNSKNVGNKAESIKKSQRKCKQKMKDKKGIMSYLQKNVCGDHITKDNIKMESVGSVSINLLDDKEVNKEDGEMAVKDFTVCKAKCEAEISNSSVLESDCQRGTIETCTEVSDDQSVKSRKRKLRRSSSGTKKKLKLSDEEPVPRRRSLRNQPQVSIELDINNPATTESSDPEKAERFTAVKDDNDNIYPENSHVVVDDSVLLEKENVENNQNNSISTEEKKVTPTLRRSTRVRKKVMDYIPNDIEIEDNEQDESFEEISKSESDLKIESDENSIVEIAASQESSNDDVQILKTTLINAIETLDLLEQSPRKSPRKPVVDVTVDEDYMNSCLSWTEKYQPNKARYVIGDKSNTRQIYDWLVSWKERHESAILKMVKSENLSKQQSDSDSESEESDFEDYLSNTMMLSGPCGCGTTATVYACANQLDFKVLELNPSIYRTGKQIFDQVSEAVVSHQVNKLADMNDVDKQPGDSTTDLKKVNFFISKRDKYATKKDASQTAKSSIESTFSSTSVDAMSLILFEQVDIVYDDIDRGFYQGIADLRLLAKRPIILTANDPQILESMFAEEDSWIEHISMTYPNAEKLLPMLQLMCLVEHVFVPKQLLIDFIKICKNDVRKIILQLMFWCDQGKKPLFKIWKAKNKKVEFGKRDLDKGKSVPEISVTDTKEIIIDDETVPTHSETNVFITEISPHTLPVYKDESFLNKDQILKDGRCSCNGIHGYYSFTKCSLKDQYSTIDHIASTANNISEMNSRLAIDQNYFEMDHYKWTSTLSDSISDTFAKEKEKAFTYPMVSVCKNVKKIYKENYESFMVNEEKQIDCVDNIENISYTDMYKSALESHSAKYHINRKPFLEDVIPYMKKICQLEEFKFSSLHHRKRGNRRYMHYLQSCGIYLDEGVLKELTQPM